MRDVTDATFDEEVLRAGKPVVVDFWAPWCGPCRAVEPALAQLAIEAVKLNVDENPDVPARYDVLSLPTVILFADGAPRETVVGPRSRGHYEKTFASYL